MIVTLSDPIISVQGWTHDLDKLGEYTLRLRKTPIEMREEKLERINRYGQCGRVDPMRKIPKTCITKDPVHPDIAYFLPGLWPRVKQALDTRGIKYEIVDKRNPDIRPPLDMSAFEGVEFRDNQDVAIALISSLDCGIIETATAFGKCHHGDTPILMYDGSIKAAKDVKVGDVLMGDDSTPRHVLTTTRGYGPLYKYTPTKGDSYIFNDKHMLSLVNCVDRWGKHVGGRIYRHGDVLDISIEDYLKLSNTQKHYFKAYRTGVDFPSREAPALDPYFVGVYLGDGTASFGQITVPDEEILSYCETYAHSMGWGCYRYAPKNHCATLRILEPDIHKKKMHAPILAIREACGIVKGNNEKHITAPYKYGSRDVRLQLLAGLLDTDGYRCGNCMYEISTKWESLATDILFVARSLGFSAYSKYMRKVCCNTGAAGMYYRIHISGDVDSIPLKVSRKIAVPRRQIKDVLHVGFKLERIEDGEFYGFSVDGNHRYLLGDFTVTHNSFIIALLCKAYPTLNIVVTTSSTQVVNTLYEYMCKTIPGEVGILMGGKDRTAGKRVIVTTLKSLPNIPPDKVQLLFVDEAHNVGDNQAGRDIMKFAFARRFGFSASPVRNDGSGRLLEAILGPTILKMSYQEAADAGMVTPMRYYMVPCGSCPPVATREGLPEHMLKRWSYWSNRSRNEAIRRTVYAIKNVYDGQILIMVSTLAHAVELHRLLPWFRVAYYGSVDMNELRERFPQSKYPGIDLEQYKMNAKQLDIMRGAFAKGTLRYVISTKVFRQGVSFNELACLIRADGDTSEIECIQVPGRLSRLDKGKMYAYLIDIMDTFSDWALRRAKSRQSQYDKQQWEQITYEELLNGLGEQSTGNSEEPPGEQCQQ